MKGKNKNSLKKANSKPTAKRAMMSAKRAERLRRPMPGWKEEDRSIWESFFDTSVMRQYLDWEVELHLAIEAGDREITVPTDIFARLFLCGVNFADPLVVEAWNSTCDRAGFPDKKKPLPGNNTADFKPEDMVAKEAFTVGHALRPLKKRPNTDDEGEAGKGPF